MPDRKLSNGWTLKESSLDPTITLESCAELLRRRYAECMADKFDDGSTLDEKQLQLVEAAIDSLEELHEYECTKANLE